jgi:hypothetical protein
MNNSASHSGGEVHATFAGRASIAIGVCADGRGRASSGAGLHWGVSSRRRIESAVATLIPAKSALTRRRTTVDPRANFRKWRRILALAPSTAFPHGPVLRPRPLPAKPPERCIIATSAGLGDGSGLTSPFPLLAP